MCLNNKHIWMGIINLSPSSFSTIQSKNLKNKVSFSRSETIDRVLDEAKEHIKQGAHILDIGAVPSNPNITNALISPTIELDLLIPVLKALKTFLITSNVLISVDTYSPQVAYTLAQLGLVDIINDINGSQKYESFEIYENNLAKSVCMNMIGVVSQFSLGYILMHMFGELNALPQHDNHDSIQECKIKVLDFFTKKKDQLLVHDVDFCIFDPGVGGGRFGKTAQQNLALISSDFLNSLNKLGFPILIGLSRKSFLTKLDPSLSTPVSRDKLSKQLEKQCFANGVKIIRTHKVSFNIID